ncbi:hypothetical protein EV424DRAFT_1531948 [Suillus variegatus]|nr:hypothetical protein EV424DRAFT_1531948 [Suillus variegatus]
MEENAMVLASRLPPSEHKLFPFPRSETSSLVSNHSGAESLIGSTRSSQCGTRPGNRSHPYSRRGAPTQLELCFALRAVQRNPDINLTDVIQASGPFQELVDYLTVTGLGWEIQEAQYNAQLLNVFERKEKKRLKMAESDCRLFKRLLVSRELPALQRDAEYLAELHDLELESLATADEQLYQMSSISPLAKRYVSHRLPNSSNTEYEAGEEADVEEQSNGSIDSDHDEIEAPNTMMNDPPPRSAKSTSRRKPNTARKAFRPGLHSDLNPSGQSVTNQLGLPGDRAATPMEYQMVPQQYPLQFQVPAPEQYQALAPQQYHMPVQQYHAPVQQYQMPTPHQYQVLAPYQSELPHAQPQPWYHQQHEQTLLDQHPAEENEDRAVAEAYAGAFALLCTGSSRLPSQPNTVGDGSLAPWGAAQLFALAPLHFGESTCGERTQGVIRTQKHISDTVTNSNRSAMQSPKRDVVC